MGHYTRPSTLTGATGVAGLIAGKTLIGRTDCPLGALRGTKLENKFYQLKGASGKAGRLSLQIKYIDPNPSAGGGGSGGASAPSDAGDAANEGAGNAAATEEEMAQRKKNQSLIKQDLGNLSTKPADYQIRVKVIQVSNSLQLKSLRPPYFASLSSFSLSPAL